MPTLEFNTGFETGITPFGVNLPYQAQGGTPTVIAGAARNGSYGLRLVGVANQQYVSPPDFVITNTRAIGRFAFKIHAGCGTVTFFRVENAASSGNAFNFRYNSTSNLLELTTGAVGTQTVRDSVALTADDTWHYIDFDFNVVANPWVYSWAFDGASQASGATIALAASALYRWRLGSFDNFTGTFDLDDVALSKTGGDYPIGNGFSELVKPSSLTPATAGTFVRDATATAIDATDWARVDDQPFGDTTDYIRQTGGSSDLTNGHPTIGFSNTRTDAINGVRAWVQYGAASTQTNTVRSWVRANATDTYLLGTASTNVSVGAVGPLYRAAQVANGGVAWSDAILDGTVFRFGTGSGTDVNPIPRWDAFALEVDYVLSIQAVGADTFHANTADTVTLTQVHNLTVADTANTHTSDAGFVQPNLIVADSAHGHTTENVTVTSSVSLVVADTFHGNTADSPTLTQVHSLTVADTANGNTADAATLTQQHTLVGASDSAHGHTTEAVALTQVHTLAGAADSAHAHTTDAVALTQAHNLAAQDTANAHTGDAVALTQVHVLTVADTANAHTTDAGFVQPNLVVADSAHSHLVKAELVRYTFEDGTTGSWTGPTGVALTNSAVQAHTGTKSLAATRTVGPGTDGGASSPYITAVPGEIYYGRSWGYETQSGTVLQNFLTCWSTAGSVVTGQVSTVGWGTQNAWAQSPLLAITAPALTTTISLFAYVYSQTIGTATYIDDAVIYSSVARLTEVSSPTLAPADTSNAHTSDAVALTQAHTLAGVADSAHGHTTEAVVLTQVHSLSVNDSEHLHTTDHLVLTQVHGLTGLADTAHAHTAENVALTQGHVLAASDTSNAHTSDAVVLTQQHLLTPADTANAHSGENVALTQVHTLAGAGDSAHTHSTDAVALTQVHAISAADSFHGHTTDAVALTQVHQLVVADSAHSHTTEAVTLSAAGDVDAHDSEHAHATESVTLTQVHTLQVQDTGNGHTSDPVTLVANTTLAPSDSLHGHRSAAVALTQQHALQPADSAHSHTSEAVTLTLPDELAVQDSFHQNTTESVLLGQVHYLTVQDSSHLHVIDGGLAIGQVHLLIPSDSLHQHTSENVTVEDTSGFRNLIVTWGPLARVRFTAPLSRTVRGGAVQRIDRSDPLARADRLGKVLRIDRTTGVEV
jgi:hypothetical protein